MNADTLQHVVPVGYIIVAVVIGLVAALGTAWGGFVWLLARIDDRFKDNLKGDVFEVTVQRIVANANAGWLDIYNRQHEEHRRASEELRKRDDERAEAIKRLHGRMDSVWERLGGQR